MALDPQFLEDCPYAPEALLIDEVLEVNREQSMVRVRMPVHAELPLTRAQRVHPERHPRHQSLLHNRELAPDAGSYKKTASSTRQETRGRSSRALGPSLSAPLSEMVGSESSVWTLR